MSPIPRSGGKDIQTYKLQYYYEKNQNVFTNKIQICTLLDYKIEEILISFFIRLCFLSE